MHTARLGILVAALLLFSIFAHAISADEAIAIVSAKNNYLMPDETATTAKSMVTYQSQKYILVAAKKGDSITCYIPVKSSDGNIATKDVEIRELIKAGIAYTEMAQLKDSTSPANWLFSYSSTNYFYDLQNEFNAKASNLLLVKTELEKINEADAIDLATQAGELQASTKALADKSKELAEQIDAGRAKEESFLTAPDTNAVAGYESSYKSAFSSIDSYKDNYSAVDAGLTSLSQGIGSLATNKLTIDQKQSLQSLLTEQVNARRLPTFFSSTTQLRTLIEGVFSDAKNTEGYAATLTNRKARNEAWMVLYGPSDSMQKIDSSFTSLQKAAEALLSEENKDLWAEQDAVTGLKTNWEAAQARYNNSEYDKAKEFALKAQTSVKQVVAGGTKTQQDTISQDLIVKVIGVLVLLAVGLFVFENFVAKKKKGEEEDYDEPSIR